MWDIETTPIEARTWTLYPNSIRHNHIIRDWSIICASFKELGENEVTSFSIHANPTKGSKDKLNDYEVVKKMRNYLQDVDIIVAHNGDKFDLKKFTSRLIFHNLPPLPKILTIDTLKEIKKVSSNTSNRLDYLAKHWGYEGKLPHSSELWTEVMEGSMEAVDYMVEYCEEDVRQLEKVYLRARPYMKAHPNIATDGTHNCPKCNSDNVHRHKQRTMARSGIKKIQYHCQDCGSYFTHRIAEKDEITRLAKQPHSRV